MATVSNSDTALRFGQIAVHTRWFSLLAGIVMLLVFDTHGWIGPALEGLIALALFVTAYNATVQFLLRRWHLRGGTPDSTMVTRLRRLSTLADVVVFAGLLHLTGGVESPLIPFFLMGFVLLGLYASIGEMLVYGIVNLLLTVFVAIQEMSGALLHHNIGPYLAGNRYQEPGYVYTMLAYWTALLLTGVGVIMVIRGVLTQREERLEKRQEQLDRFKSFQIEILHHLPVGIVVFGSGGRITMANQLALDLLRIQLEDNRNIFRIPSFRQSGLMAFVEGLLSGENVELFDFPFVAEDGVDKRWIRVLGVPPDETQRGILMVEDVTESKQREERERKIHEQLSQADKFTSLGQMASGVAHELNNPLTGIVGAAQYLQYVVREGKLDGPSVEEKTSHILTQGKRIEQLVRGLLSYSKPGTGGATQVNVRMMVDELLSFSAFELRRGKVTLDVDVEPELPMFVGNKTDLQQMILNLLTNARHAVGSDGGRVSLQICRLDGDDGDELCITISDNGCGIPPEVSDRIFEPFFTTKGPEEGTGLGLPIVHAVVERYKGRIHIDTPADGGTVFEIRLPYQDELDDWDPEGEATFSPYR